MVRYFCEDIRFEYKNRQFNNRWLKLVAESEICRLGDINIIFCSDPYILGINLQYLGHDYFTDIITFDYSDKPLISGDLFISVDSVRENAEFYGTEFQEELHRVIVHGILHLIGYDDHTESDTATMRSKENYYLLLRKSLSGDAR
jgi:rRNA maturation RNase YbeY